MSKTLCYFNLVFLFIYQISLAQSKPELINSGEGIGKKFFADGKTAWQYNYFLGLLHGLQTTYYPNGNLRSEENWYNGEQNGVSKYYDENGKITETRIYYYDILLSVNK